MPKRATEKQRAGAGSTADRIGALRKRLAQAIPHPQCELDHDGPWQLLIATILSAQSTDKNVNKVTPDLFRRWPSPAALGAADRAEIETVVKSTGFFRNKAKAIQETSRVIAAEYDGEVPRSMEEMCQLPGVARKTANVVLGTACGLSTGIVVDTHVTRVAQRLGLTAEKDPVKIERDLCAHFAKRSWVDTGHRLLLHGRYLCTARAPQCRACPLNELCDAREAEPTGSWTARARAEGKLVRGERQGEDGRSGETKRRETQRRGRQR